MDREKWGLTDKILTKKNEIFFKENKIMKRMKKKFHGPKQRLQRASHHITSE